MEAVTVYIGGREVPLVRLEYADVEKAIQDWHVAGVTDPLGQLVAWLRDQVAALVASVRDAILSALGTISSSLSSAITGAINTIVSSITSGIQTLVSNISSALSSVVSSIGGVITSAINTLSSSISSALGIIRDAITSAVSGIANALSGLAGLITSTITNLVSSITNVLGSIANAIVSAITSAVQTIVSAIQNITSSISSAVGSIVSTITSALSGFASAIAAALSGAVNSIVSAIRDITSALSGVVSAITASLNSLASQIQAAISALASQMSSLLRAVVDAVTGVISRIIDALGSVGRDILARITGAFTALTNTLTSIFSNIVAGLQSITTAFQGFVNSIARLADLISSRLRELVSSLDGFFKDPAGVILKALTDAWKALMDITKPIWEPLQAFFSEVGKFLGNIWESLAKAVGDAWAAFVEFTKPIWEPIKSFIDFVSKTVWDSINTFIQLFTRNLEEFFKDPVGFIVRQIATLWSGFVEFTKPIWEPIGKFLDDAAKFLGDLWENISIQLRKAWEFFVELTSPIWKPIQTIMDSIAKGFEEFFRDPAGYISRQITTLWSGFVEFTRPIWEPLEGFLKDVGKFFSNLLTTLSDIAQPIVKFITEDIPRFFTHDLPKFLMEDLPEILLNTGRAVLLGLQKISDAVLSAIKFLGELLMRAVVFLIDVGRGLFEPFFRSFADSTVASLREAIKPGSPPKEVEALVSETYQIMLKKIDSNLKLVAKHGQVTEAILGVSIGLAGAFAIISSIAQIGGMIADLPHPFKTVGARKLAKSLIDNIGGFFLMSSISASYTFFVLHPLLRRYFQKAARPVLPGPDTMTTMFFRNTFSDRDYQVHMAELGYQDMFIQGFIDVNANIPTVSQMIRLVGAGLVKQDEALKQLKKAGWIGERGWLGPEVMFEGMKEPPQITNALEMFWRGYINKDELRKIYVWQGRHETYFEAETESQYRIPPVSDLITFVIREVLEPEDFRVLLQKQGFQPKEVIAKTLGRRLITPLIGGGRGEGDWADAYWEAHWRLPSPEQIFDFYNRAVVGLVSVEGKVFQVDAATAEKAVIAYNTLQDYKPEPRELFGFLKQKTGLDRLPVADETLVRSLRYRILTRIESRFVRRWALISTDDYMRLGAAQGIDPFLKIKTLDGTEMTMLEALTTAEFLQDLIEERTSLRTQILNAYIKGFNIKTKVVYIKDRPGEVEEREIETLKLGDALKALRFRPEEISWLLAQALIRRSIEIREDRIKIITDDFVSGVIQPEDFENELKTFIDDEDVRKTVVEFFMKKRMRERLKKALTRIDRDLLREMDTHLRLYENGFGKRDDVVKLMDELIQKGLMAEQEKAILLSISESRRKRELVELALRALGKRVGRGEISPDDFLKEAEKLGVDKEFSERLVEVYTPLHTLSVAALISYADEVPIPIHVLERKLKALRVPSDEAQIIRLVVSRRPVADEIRSLGSILQSLARDLETTSGEAVGLLKALGLTDEELKIRALIIDRLNILAIKRQLRRTLDVLLREQYEALSRGRDPRLITLKQYYEVYKKMGYPDDFIVARAQEILANFKLLTEEWKTLKTRIERGG